MMMEIFLNEEKAKANHFNIKKCYEALDNFFEERNIKKMDQGVYQGCDNQESFTAFGVAIVHLPRTNWFLKIVDEWYWRADSDDIEDREDCLEAYYKYRG